MWKHENRFWESLNKAYGESDFSLVRNTIIWKIQKAEASYLDNLVEIDIKFRIFFFFSVPTKKVESKYSNWGLPSEEIESVPIYRKQCIPLEVSKYQTYRRASVGHWKCLFDWPNRCRLWSGVFVGVLSFFLFVFFSFSNCLFDCFCDDGTMVNAQRNTIHKKSKEDQIRTNTRHTSAW